MKMFLALMEAMTLMAFAYAQGNTSCSAQDLSELTSLTARFNECRSSLPCPQDQKPCACCESILQSNQPSNDSFATNCCREFQAGLALYQRCKDILNNSGTKKGLKTTVALLAAELFLRCVIHIVTRNGAQLVQAISAMTITAVAFLHGLLHSVG